MSHGGRKKTLDLLKVFATKIYGKDIAMWLFRTGSLQSLGISNLLDI